MRLSILPSIVVAACSVLAQQTPTGTRDPWLWPFAATSIWNMPIGSGAVFDSAHLESAANVGFDVQFLVKTSAALPARDVFEATTNGKCGGTILLDFKLRLPDDYLVPPHGESPYGLTPNNNCAILLDNDTVFEATYMVRCVAGGPVFFPSWLRYPNNRHYENIRGDGASGGGQGASGMSSLGGTIRLGELSGTDPIRHAIKINPWAAKYCYYSSTVPGFRWPARSCDSYAPTQYAGTNPALVMGALLAIPPSVTESSLGLKSAAAKKLFFALQNYGAYFTEDAAWDTWDLIVERDAEKEIASITAADWKSDINALVRSLAIVSNNGPMTIGGGGTPRQPLAPAFGSTGIADEGGRRSLTAQRTVVRGSAAQYRADGRIVALGKARKAAPGVGGTLH